VVATGPEEDEDPDERKEKPDKRRFISFSVLFDVLSRAPHVLYISCSDC
jgi:hypothetical protein